MQGGEGYRAFVPWGVVSLQCDAMQWEAMQSAECGVRSDARCEAMENDESMMREQWDEIIRRVWAVWMRARWEKGHIRTTSYHRTPPRTTVYCAVYTCTYLVPRTTSYHGELCHTKNMLVCSITVRPRRIMLYDIVLVEDSVGAMHRYVVLCTRCRLLGICGSNSCYFAFEIIIIDIISRTLISSTYIKIPYTYTIYLYNDINT